MAIQWPKKVLISFLHFQRIIHISIYNSPNSIILHSLESCASQLSIMVFSYISLIIKWDMDKTLTQMISTVFLPPFFLHWSMNYFVRSPWIHFKFLPGLYIADIFSSGNYWIDYIILKAAIHNSPISDCIQWPKKRLISFVGLERMVCNFMNTEHNCII